MCIRDRPKTPFVLLGLLTVLTAGGPLAIFLVLRGGQSRSWPPDRPIEWIIFVTVIVVFVAVMLACLAIGIANWRRLATKPLPKTEEDAPLS